MSEQSRFQNFRKPKLQEKTKTAETVEVKDVELSQQELEKRELRKQVVNVAKNLLVDDFVEADIDGLSDEELGEYIQIKFQEHLENFFTSSGLEEEIKTCKDDEELLHLITNKTEGIRGWVNMLPNIKKEYEGSGMNCTMGSAMLHLALEKLGYKNVRTVTVMNHHIVLRELEDGSIKIYDSGSKITKDGKLLGYSHTFTPEQIVRREEVDEKSGRRGFSLTLNRGEQDDGGGFYGPDREGHFTQKLYAFDSSIKMDVSIALDNLSCIEADAIELGGAGDRPLIDENNYLREVADFFRLNNQIELTDENLRTIAHENSEAKKKFIKASEQSFISQGIISGSPIPNPYDYFKNVLLQPKKEMGDLPNPVLFISGASERHEQAKALCAKYPELKNMSSKKIYQQFGLFHADKLIE